MLKNVTSIEVKRKKDEKEMIYQMLCENHATLGELYDVLCEMRGYVLERIKAHHEADNSQRASSPSELESAPEEQAEQAVNVECQECQN